MKMKHVTSEHDLKDGISFTAAITNEKCSGRITVEGDNIFYVKI